MNIIIRTLILFFLFLSLYGCSKMDATYKEFLTNSDKLYPGKVDSVQVFTGRERIKFDVLLSSDPKVKKVKVFWDGREQSFETPVNPEEIGRRKEILIPAVEEGDYTFYLITYDRDDNPSIPVEIFSRVYGDAFESNLINRFMISENNFETDSVEIHWAEADLSYADLRVEINYEDADGSAQVIFVEQDELRTTLRNYKWGLPFSYQTIVQPDSTCMDEFRATAAIGHVHAHIDDQKLADWTVAAVSSEDDVQTAEKCIDGYETDDGTKSYWSTNAGNGDSFPHWIVLDLGKPTPANGFYFVQRTVGYTGQLLDIDILTNATGDDTDTWMPLSSGTLMRTAGRQLIAFERATPRYVKIVFKNSWVNTPILSLMELGIVEKW